MSGMRLEGKVAVDTDADGAERVAAEIGGVAVTADVSREDDVERYVAVAVQRFGRIDLHHLNAGIPGSLDPLPSLDVAGFERVLSVNKPRVVCQALRRARS